MGRKTVDERLEQAESLLRVAKVRAAEAQGRVRDADREVAEAQGRVRRLREERERAAERDPLASVTLQGDSAPLSPQYMAGTVRTMLGLGKAPSASPSRRDSGCVIGHLVRMEDLEVVVGRELLAGPSPDERILLCEDDPDFADADGRHVLVVRPTRSGS